MEAKIFKKVLINPREGMVVVDNDTVKIINKENIRSIMGCNVFLLYASVTKFQNGPNYSKESIENYYILEFDDVKYILNNDLIYKKVEGEIAMNPYGALWGTSGVESFMFKVSHPKIPLNKIRSNKPDSLCEMLKTKEQVYNFMRRLNELDGRMDKKKVAKGLPIELIKCESDTWLAIYQNCVSQGDTADEAEEKLYALIDAAYKDSEAERLKLATKELLPIEYRKMDTGDWSASYECCSGVGSTREEAEKFVYEMIHVAFIEAQNKLKSLNETP